MKKSEFTDEWQDVLIPARVKRDPLGYDDYVVAVHAIDDRWEGSEKEPFGGHFGYCKAYRHFILVPKGAKVTVSAG